MSGSDQWLQSLGAHFQPTVCQVAKITRAALILSPHIQKTIMIYETVAMNTGLHRNIHSSEDSRAYATVAAAWVDDARLAPPITWTLHVLLWDNLLGQAEVRNQDTLEVSFRDERTPPRREFGDALWPLPGDRMCRIMRSRIFLSWRTKTVPTPLSECTIQLNNRNRKIP